MQHKNPTQPNRTAHAPYNFVPFPEKVKHVDTSHHALVEEIANRDQVLNGYISVKMITKSPIYVRGMKTVEMYREDKENTDNATEPSDFFHIGTGIKSRFAIPGSSIRGMIRQLVRQITDGKVTDVDDKTRIYMRSVAEPNSYAKDFYQGYVGRVKAGYIRKQGDAYVIIPASTKLKDRQRGTPSGCLKLKSKLPKYVNRRLTGFYDNPLCSTFPSNRQISQNGYSSFVYNFEEVSFDFDNVRGRISAFEFGNSLPHSAALICAGDMRENFDWKTFNPNDLQAEKLERKTYYVILEPDEKAKRFEVPKSVIKDMQQGGSDDQQYFFFDEDGDLYDDAPCFFVEDKGKVLCFGHSPNFRVPVQIEEDDIWRAIRPNDLVPTDLKDLNTPDLVDAMFGFIANNERANKDDQAAALLSRLSFGDAIMHEDSDPYWKGEEEQTVIMGQPKPTAYPLYLAQNNPDERKVVLPYSEETALRGYKGYWHHPDLEELPQASEDKESVSTKIRPLRADLTFEFKIHFDNLTYIELGALLWALKPQGEEGKEYCHKIGGGKGLGLGSVKLESDLYLIDRKARYETLFDDEGAWEKGESNTTDFSSYTNAFERFMGKTPLKDDPRIQALLTMMDFEAMNGRVAKLRYMNIETDKQKYREKYVLPDPLSLASNNKKLEEVNLPVNKELKRV